MYEPEMREVTPIEQDRNSRTLVIIDGSESSWRALAWAVGYALSRHIATLDLVAHPARWEAVPDAAQAFAFMAIEFPRGDPETTRRGVLGAAREFCGVSGIDTRITAAQCTSPGDLVRLARRERPDLVIMGRIGSLRHLSTRRVISGLMRNGIPVSVIP